MAVALLAAQSRVTRDSKERKYGIYLSCDIAAAFDSLRPSAIASFLQAECAAESWHESLQILRPLLEPELHFYWQDRLWSIPQTSGVQQGGSHSAVLFSYVLGLGLALEKLERSWRETGELCKHPSFSLLFMDDLLVAFSDWAEAVRLSSQFQRVLADMGLQLNFTKTCLMSHETVLAQGRALHLPSESLLQSTPWKTSCMYLKKPLTHFSSGASTTGSGYADTTAVLVEAAGKATHPAYESLKKCFRRGHWSSVQTTMHMCNQYIGTNVVLVQSPYGASSPLSAEDSSIANHCFGTYVGNVHPCRSRT